MKEHQTIAKITKDSFKKRELRFSRIELLEKSKAELIKKIELNRLSIEPYTQFRDTCHLIPAKDLYFHPIVLSMLKDNTLKIFQLSQDGLKWKPWNFIEEEYKNKVERCELFFYEPVKKHLVLFVDTHYKHIIKPIIKRIHSIDKRIETTRRELSDIQANELHKIQIEEAFLNKKIVSIFREFNTVIYSVSECVEQVVKYKKLVCSNHLDVCIQMMRRFNEERMVLWMVKGMDEKYKNTLSVNNTYYLLYRIFNILMRMEKLVKTRIRRNTIYVRPALIATFIKEINLFKKHNNKIWIQFYTSSIPYIFKNSNFSDILIQHIYEYIYGLDKPIIYEYQKPVRRSPQSRTLTA
jgi:hypothetical protein